MRFEEARAKELEKQYRHLGLADLYPGFNNEDVFIAAETNDTSLLASYAEYVNLRFRANVYDEHVRRIIPNLVDIICDHLTNYRLEGTCAQTVYIMSQLLNHFGIWNYILKDAVNIELMCRPDLPKQFFWIIEEPYSDELGHYWIVAPPFHVVDPSIPFQLWPEDYLHAISNPLTVQSIDRIQPNVEDLVSYSTRAKYDMEDGNLHYKKLPYLREFNERFPANQFISNDVRYRYTPVKIYTVGLPQNLPPAETDFFRGKDLWEKAIAILERVVN